MERLTIVSSDGHAVGQMEMYRDYVEPHYRADFEDFLVSWRTYGAAAVSEKALRRRTDDDVVDRWASEVLETGRADGYFDLDLRIAQLDESGVAAEVLFPDFGTPFSMGSGPIASLGQLKRYTLDYIGAGLRAHNRWVADFVSPASERFALMAALTFDDVDAAVREIRWAREAGFCGIVLPPVADDAPLFDPRYEPIWNELEELGMLVNSHAGLSATLPPWAMVQPPLATTMSAMLGVEVFIASQRHLRMLIWGGILERHPRLRVVFSELHSDWVLPTIAHMDFAYDRGELRNDIKTIVPLKPSEYWERQGFLGSSLFSRSEIRHRHAIGVDKIMLGYDYPHFEGAWRHGVDEYLRCTLGVEHVPIDEARKMLSDTAIDVYEFDRDVLTGIAGRIGPTADDALGMPREGAEASLGSDVARPSVFDAGGYSAVGV